MSVVPPPVTLTRALSLSLSLLLSCSLSPSLLLSLSLTMNTVFSQPHHEHNILSDSQKQPGVQKDSHTQLCTGGCLPAGPREEAAPLTHPRRPNTHISKSEGPSQVQALHKVFDSIYEPGQQLQLLIPWGPPQRGDHQCRNQESERPLCVSKSSPGARGLVWGCACVSVWSVSGCVSLCTGASPAWGMF